MALLPFASASSDNGVASILLAVGTLAIGVVVVDRLTGNAGDEATDAPPGAVVAACEDAAGECAGATTGAPGEPPVLDAARVCPSAGYLCAGLSENGEVRVVRWNDDTRRIRARVPPPPGVEGPEARALQEAAARGIRAWHQRPFQVRVDLSERPGRHDFVVRWSPQLGGRELGRTRTHWVRRDGRTDLQVREFSLATHNPADPSRLLSARQIELTAAHEMGHVLGLSHSDDRDDVMFPENTATRLTARDYTTLSALYELENGAYVR